MALKVKAKEKLQKIGTNTGGNPGSGAEGDLEGGLEGGLERGLEGDLEGGLEGDLEGGSGFCFSTKVKENKKKLRPTSRQTLRLLKVTIFTLTNNLKTFL